MSKVLIIGAAGQLGQCLKIVAQRRSITNVIFPTEQEANILDNQLLAQLFEKEKPSYVINCAAYTAVDKAESEIDLSRAINETGAVNLAKTCKEYGSTLVHISTDFVFDGSEVKLLREEDEAQ